MGLSSHVNNNDGTITVTTSDNLKLTIVGKWSEDNKIFTGQITKGIPESDIWFDGEHVKFTITQGITHGILCCE